MVVRPSLSSTVQYPVLASNPRTRPVAPLALDKKPETEEEEEEDNKNRYVKLRSRDFKIYGWTIACPGCVRMRRRAKPPYRHNMECRKRLELNIRRDDTHIWERYELRKPSEARARTDSESSADSEEEATLGPRWVVLALRPVGLRSALVSQKAKFLLTLIDTP